MMGHRERAKARVARRFGDRAGEPQVSERLGLHEADERAPHEGDHRLGGDVASEDAARLEVDDQRTERLEHRALEPLAFGIEVRRVVMELEEAERHRLLGGERHERVPERIEGRSGARRVVRVSGSGEERGGERHLDGPRHAALGVAERGVEEGFFARKESVERAGADARALHHFWNGRSFESGRREAGDGGRHHLLVQRISPRLATRGGRLGRHWNDYSTFCAPRKGGPAIRPRAGATLRGVEPPRSGTVERWAWDYVTTTSLAHKLAPPPVPDAWLEDGVPRRLTAPGRPLELRVVARAPKMRGLGGEAGRARALATFLHHELQAAELMAFALLAFPETPRAFRAGLVRIALDEVRHMGMYGALLEARGHRYGEEPVRDWFWERVGSVRSPAEFLAIMGLGVESANLEHSASYAARFRAAGDDEGARVQERIGQEEIAHVRFGARWFGELVGPLTFEAWTASLPPPLTPLLMRGAILNREARRAAGQPEDFLNALERWEPTTTTNRAPGS